MTKPNTDKHFDHEGIRYPKHNRPAAAVARAARDARQPRKGGKQPATPK